MRKIIVSVLVISLTGVPHVTLAQKVPPRTPDKQRRAEQIADHFIKRFQQTLELIEASFTFM